jgi:LmbE family N-acetylglucosaminyl deacetylase
MNINIKKIACVFAHPDDEAFGPGGTIAQFVKNSKEVEIICVTGGDADKRFSGKISGQSLGLVRQQELLNSAKILGVKKVYFLNFPDGSLNNNNYHEVADKIKQILVTSKPDTIMTFELNGVSGHLDHVAVSFICSYLFERLGFIKNIMYFCNSEKEKKIIGKKYFVYFPDGYKKENVDLVIDVKPEFNLKKKAMWAHVSQRKDALWLLTIFRKQLKEEYFRIKQK